MQMKFDIDPTGKTWVMKSLASKWRNWKARLKADHYNPHTTDEERLKDCNKRVLPDQWAALVLHWNSEEVQVCASYGYGSLQVIICISCGYSYFQTYLWHYSCVVLEIRLTVQSRRVPMLQVQRALQGYARKR